MKMKKLLKANLFRRQQ